MTGDPLGDRMKRYEEVTRYTLPRRTYTVIRVDGRAFHTLLRHAGRPWDERVVACMQETARYLCGEVAGVVLAYTQSDEISLVLQDFETTATEPWFGGSVQKIVSVGAAAATAAFTRSFRQHFDLDNGALPTFDARVFTIPDVVEVANYLVWRQRDAQRNSVLALAQSYYSHRELQGVGVRELRNRLKAERGVDWETDVDAGLRNGWLVRRESREVGGVWWTTWETEAAPEFRADGEGILARLLPEPRLLT